MGFVGIYPPSLDLGDYSTNVAYKLAKKSDKKVAEIADDIKSKIEKDDVFLSVFSEIKNERGFLNFFLKKEYLNEEFSKILKSKDKYGDLKIGKDEKINLEFVSANPTGPMTVHNVRAAAYGDCLGNIFNKAGYKCSKEYYINDVGVQVEKLGKSVYRRLQELKGEEIEFEEGLYKGDYIIDIARELLDHDVPTDEGEAFKYCSSFAREKLILSAQNSLKNIGVEFNEWFKESSLHESSEVKDALKYLEDKDLVYDKEEAKWFKVGEFYPEEDDAVVVKSDGSTSYLMNDIAYTKNKIEKRGFNKAINIWGTDHHGDVKRLLAGAKALGYEDGKLEILLHQLVSVKDKDEQQRMSKREGKFILLDDFLKKVAKDPLRYFFLVKDLNTHMEFDVALAQEQSNKNPVFYIQYAYARINSLFDKSGVEADKVKMNTEFEDVDDLNIIRKMIKFPELIEAIAGDYRVHSLAEYTFDLSNDFHKYYEAHRVINEGAVDEQKIALIFGIGIIISICLGLMGLSAPEKM